MWPQLTASKCSPRVAATSATSSCDAPERSALLIAARRTLSPSLSPPPPAALACLAALALSACLDLGNLLMARVEAGKRASLSEVASSPSLLSSCSR